MLEQGAATMGDVPCWLVHGARDQSGPLDGPRRLAAAWPGCELIVVDDGHGGDEMTAVFQRLLAELAGGTSGTDRAGSGSPE